MKAIRLVLLLSIWSLLCLRVSAQSRDSLAVASKSDVQAVHPFSVVREDPELDRIDLIAGVRLDGHEGTPTAVAIKTLNQYSDLLGMGATEKDFRVRDVRFSRAGGFRIYVDVISRVVGIQSEHFLLGLNRPLAGSRSYIDARGNIAAPGHVFVQSDDLKQENEIRSDWYVYFISRVGSEMHKVLAQNEADVTNEWDYAGIERINSVPGRSDDDSALAFEIEDRVSETETCLGNNFSASGHGQVYRTNPLSGLPEDVILENLCSDSPLRLSGRVALVNPDAESPLVSNDGDFHFDVGVQEFDEVSLYYHFDNFLSVLFDRGVDPSIAENWKISVRTQVEGMHTMISRYTYHELLVGEPAFPYQNVVYESAIIVHEVMHFWMYDFLSTSYLAWGEKEHWAMGESYADYFGLVYRAFQRGDMQPWLEPVIGQYHALVPTENLPRDLSSRLPHYSGYGIENYAGHGLGGSSGNLYDNSMIFSTALLDYDRLDQSENSSSFVIESLLNMPDGPSFANGRDALMVAANECALIKYPNQYECCESGNCHKPVVLAFTDRGMAPTNEVITGVSAPNGTISVPGESPILWVTNYPNPFNYSTTLQFQSNRTAHVSLRIYDAGGKLVDELFNQRTGEGLHSLLWKPQHLPSGPYFYQIDAEGFSSRGSLLLVK